MPERLPRILPYRNAGGTELSMHVFPADGSGTPKAGLVLFHGGGWCKGEPAMLYRIARSLQEDGVSVFLPQYRLMPVHQASLWDLVGDAHAAMSWIHDHAPDYDLEPAKIGAGGGSAGGHLALCTELIPPREGNRGPRPAFLVLGNPVIDTSASGFGQSLAGNDWEALSPLHQIRPGIPATVIFHGTADTTTPIAGVEAFLRQSRDNGDACLVHAYPGRRHAFFNQEPDIHDVIDRMKAFIARWIAGTHPGNGLQRVQ
jgi:acetyl esterase/lipase